MSSIKTIIFVLIELNLEEISFLNCSKLIFEAEGCSKDSTYFFIKDATLHRTLAKGETGIFFNKNIPQVRNVKTIFLNTLLY